MKADVSVELDTILARPAIIAVVSVTNAADGTPVAGLKATAFRAIGLINPGAYASDTNLKILWFRAHPTKGLYAMRLRTSHGPGHHVVAVRIDGHGSSGWGNWTGEGLASGTMAALPTARSARSTTRKRSGR